jgi:hypothetical protein
MSPSTLNRNFKQCFSFYLISTKPTQNSSEIPASKGRQRRKEKWKPWTLFSLCLLVSAADCLGNFFIFLVTFLIKATERSELANTLKKQTFMSKKVIGVWGKAPFEIVNTITHSSTTLELPKKMFFVSFTGISPSPSPRSKQTFNSPSKSLPFKGKQIFFYKKRRISLSRK